MTTAEELLHTIRYWEHKLKVGKRELFEIEIHIAQLYEEYEKKLEEKENE